MTVQKFLAAAAIFAAAGTAFAADAAPASAAAPAVANAGSAVLAANLNLPVVSISKNTGVSRAAVHAEAVDFVKNYKTTLAVQLDQYKN